MALELEYRRTFIDVVEKPKFLIRYHSLPAFGTPTDTCEDATLKDYVLKLSGSNVRADLPKHPETKVESQVSSRARIESLGSIESIGESIGSMGHGWGLCKRPCALYLSGHCKHGADCGFCHLSHQHRLPKLDKQQREKLKMLSVSQLLSLILEPLKMKVAEQRIENEAAEIMGLIELEAAKARCGQGKEARPGAGTFPIISLASHCSPCALFSLFLKQHVE